MANLQQEREHLIMADRHILAGEQRIADQMLRIAEMSGKGQDTQEARKLLLNYRDTLETWQAHRELIRDAIARGEARAGADSSRP
jgi:hypothetical protein